MSNHSHRPVNRREFLSRLATGYAAVSFTPTLLSWLFSQQAKAAGTAATDLMPFLVFDLVGGASLPGNFLVGNAGGPEDLIASYSTHGWNPKDADSLDRSFGLPMSKKFSQMLAGIKSTASPEALVGLRFSSILHFSQDDVNNNALSAVAMVHKAGCVGTTIKEPLGTQATASGGNSVAALQNLGSSAVLVNSLQVILESAGFVGALSTMSPAVLQKFSASAKKLNVEQMKALGNMGGADQLASLQGAFFDKTSNPLATSPLDPRSSASTQRIYGLTQNSSVTARDSIMAGITMGAISGSSGPGVISIGGCDYHDGTQASGDAKDLEVGREIGRAVELAYQLKKPLFMQILTDGGISAQPGTRIWTGDSGVRGMTVMGVYEPNLAFKQRRLQVGRYTNGEVADQTTIVGQDRTKVAATVFANYLNVAGRLDLYEKILGNGAPVAAAELDQVLCFDKS